MDSLSITAIIAAIGALILSILTHIKTSSCYGLNIRTTESHTPVLTHFPELVNNESKTEQHTITESRPPTPNILIQSNRPTIISASIPIPTTPLLTRANFL